MNPPEPKEKSPKERFMFNVLAILVLVVIFVGNLGWPVGRQGRKARIGKAKIEITGISAAIHQYVATYGRFPVVSNLTSGSNSDFTFGTFGTSVAALGITNAGGYQANNSEVMAVIMDWTNYPDGRKTINADHSLNPQRIIFFEAKVVDNTNSAGIGSDGVYRDPWGHPYIITLDLSGDGKCRDAFYRLANVSGASSSTNGLRGLTRSEARDGFEANTTIMLWSLGPDGKADRSIKADQGVNKDNILSWY